MQALSDPQLLEVWERGHRRSAVARAVLLAAQCPGIADRDARALCIGERDTAILQVRRATFGTQLQGSLQCPNCAQPLEFDFDCSALPEDVISPERTEFTAHDMRFRLPNSHDLMAVAQTDTAEDAAQALLRRCCLEESATIDCSEALVAEVEGQISAADAASDIRFGFTCTSCAHAWEERLDIAAWCWDEVELRAQRLLSEVHRLAWAYGWSEAQILSLGAARRRAYLELCES